MRRWSIVVMLLACLGILGQAQESLTFPTADALETLEIPRRDRVRLAQELLGVAEIESPSAPVNYEIGDRRVFNVNDNTSNTNTPVEAELIAVGEHIMIWVDTRADADPDRAAALVHEFDTIIYSKMRALWGSERTPGIDADPRVVALFTYGVGDSIAAYYASEHSLPREIAPDSNEAEMMIYNLGAYGAAFDSPSVYSVTTHEFQHMIRDNIPSNAPTWLNEGMSVFTEWLMGYEAAGPVFMEYLFQPRTQLNSWQSSGANYGTAGLFITYFFERFGVAGINALSQADGLGMSLVDHALERIGADTDADTLFADWIAANWLQEDETIYGYRDVLLFEPASVRVDTYPHTVDRRTPPYATDFYTLRDLPSGTATLTVDMRLNPSAALIPTVATSGKHMWTAVRQDDSAPTLTRAFDLRDDDAASLEYRVWYDLESHYDFAYLTVSTDGGETWDVLDTPSMRGESTYGPGYTGQSGSWVDETVSLDAYAGEEILVRFMVITDDALNNPGIALDDIRLDAADYASDLEDGGGWEGRGWLLTDNRLPARAWIQVLQRRPDGVDVQRLFASAEDSTFEVEIFEDAESIALAVSPIVPISTEPVSYALHLTVK